MLDTAPMSGRFGHGGGGDEGFSQNRIEIFAPVIFILF
jgi:hypothetical protein